MYIILYIIYYTHTIIIISSTHCVPHRGKRVASRHNRNYLGLHLARVIVTRNVTISFPRLTGPSACMFTIRRAVVICKHLWSSVAMFCHYRGKSHSLILYNSDTIMRRLCSKCNHTQKHRYNHLHFIIHIRVR